MHLQLLFFRGLILGITKREGNLRSQGSGLDVLAGQPPVEKVRAAAAAERNTVAVYRPTPIGLADGALHPTVFATDALSTCPGAAERLVHSAQTVDGAALAIFAHGRIADTVATGVRGGVAGAGIADEPLVAVVARRAAGLVRNAACKASLGRTGFP